MEVTPPETSQHHSQRTLRQHEKKNVAIT